jgi:dipeptidyl aminopeptidase/acylaminoacyl peptidase
VLSSISVIGILLCGQLASLSAAAPADPILLTGDVESVWFSAEGNPPDLTPDGRWLAYSVVDQKAPAERLVYVRDMQTGATRCLTNRDSKDGWAAGPRWSRDGRWLAFFTKPKGKTALTLWDREHDRMEVVLGPTSGFPASVSWSEASNSVFVVTEAADSPKAARVDNSPAPSAGPAVVVWRSAAAKQAEATADSRPSSPPHDDGLVIDTLTNKPPPPHEVWEVALEPGQPPATRRVLRGRGIDEIAVSPDGRWLAASGNRRLRHKWGAAVHPLVDLFLVRLTGTSSALPVAGNGDSDWSGPDGHALSPVMTDIPRDGSRDGWSWSPDSTAVASVSNGRFGTGDVFTVSIPGPGGKVTIRTHTEHASVNPTRDFLDTDEDDRYKRFGYSSRTPCGAPLWTADSRAIVRGAGGDIWYIPVNEEGVPRNLTVEDSEHHYTNPIATVQPSGVRQVSIVEDAVLVHAIDTTTLREGLWRIRLRDGARTLVASGQQSFEIGRGYGDVAELTGNIVTASSSFNEPLELWSVAPAISGRPSRFTSFNRHDITWLKSISRRDLEWKTPYGRIARGVLLLPPSPAGSPPPVIMNAYPGSARASKHLHDFGISEESAPLALLARGYAVFVFDLPFLAKGTYGPDGPVKALVDAVDAGISALAATGAIDERRIVIHGFSYGGHMVNALVTQSKRLAAGITGAGTSDLISAAGSAGFGMPYYEGGQGRMGVTLWSDPQRYIKNSPVLFLERVSAPLLLYHGVKDSNVPIGQAEEMYAGLARLSKDVTLLRYQDVRHGFHGDDVVRDLWSRILAWLDARMANNRTSELSSPENNHYR